MGDWFHRRPRYEPPPLVDDLLQALTAGGTLEPRDRAATEDRDARWAAIGIVPGAGAAAGA